MTLRLNGSSSGYVELDVPAAAGSHTLTLPDGGGSSGQYLQTNGSGGLSWQTVSTSNLTRGTAVASTSGSVIDFTSLPSGIRRIQVILDAVSSDNFYHLLIQLGTSSGFTTSGYDAQSAIAYSSSSFGINSSAGFIIFNSASNAVHSGIFTFDNVTGNAWVGSYSGGNNQSPTDIAICGGGRVALGAELTQVRITFSTAANFDAGQINLFYEV